ncbi:DUF4358 domain-containing protein [Clostridium hydrogeniformans]|uniref:DUF4358 domain-containing protein n=1 Tax=Clostridium hydrogeniformans TaxID=349933 RepID=UPI000485C06F|nr:DUF4358 domain-containing protein [Clostridium hydrogeniformans]
MKKIGLNKYFYIFFSITLCILLLLKNIIVGEIKDPSIKDIESSIRPYGDSEIMEEGDAKDLKKLYGINSKDIEDFILYMPESNMKASEIIVIRLKTKESKDIIKEKVEKRADNQGNSFENYVPEEYDLIKNKVVEEKGNYIFMVIHKDSDKIKEDFNENFK